MFVYVNKEKAKDTKITLHNGIVLHHDKAIQISPFDKLTLDHPDYKELVRMGWVVQSEKNPFKKIKSVYTPTFKTEKIFTPPPPPESEKEEVIERDESIEPIKEEDKLLKSDDESAEDIAENFSSNVQIKKSSSSKKSSIKKKSYSREDDDEA